MKRRSVLASLALLAACATQQPVHEPAQYPGFRSDRILVEPAQGNGPDVIFIPGMTSQPGVFDAATAAIYQDYRVHRVQVLGFAGTGAAGNAEGPVAAPVAEEIARYIEEAQLQRPALIGHSMGGTIAMMVAARHPDRISKVMVVDMTPFLGQMFAGPDATAESAAPVADQFAARVRATPGGMSSPALAAMFSSMVRDEAPRAMILQNARESDLNVVANSFRELIATDLRPELANIRAPMTLLYVVPQNVPMPADQYEAMMRNGFANAPQTRIIKIENSNHFIMQDQPERFLAEVRSFLAN